MIAEIINQVILIGGIIIGSIIGLFVLLVAFLLIITSITPVPLIRSLQKVFLSGKANSFKSKSNPTQKTLSGGTLFFGDIQYGKKYPNSFLDIYIPNGDTETRRPTFFFVHGGGYAWGDKVEGDPLSKGKSDESPDYLLTVAENGYNVVSINYALTPDYLYPIPIYQIDGAIKFLQESGGNYGLDMSNIIFAGESGGGQLVGQYVNIQTNPAYANEMGMTASLKKDNITAVVFNSALLDPTRFNKTGNGIVNNLFGTLGRLYFTTNNLKNNAQVDQSNVITYLSTDFPPSFITDGNTATFTDQAEDLSKRMTELGISNVFNCYDISESKLGHGYESSLDEKCAKDNFQRMIDFLDYYARASLKDD